MSGSSLAALSPSDISPAPCCLGLIGTYAQSLFGSPSQCGCIEVGHGEDQGWHSL